MLDTWPNLPIHISASQYKTSQLHSEKKSLIATLKDTSHICQIQLYEPSGSELERILQAMQKPFPALTSLAIGGSMAIEVLPQAFLGGSAQHL